MIQITDRHNCCGCEACVQICPKQCISFEEDGKGFRYPLVNRDLCIDCGLCEKVCPMLQRSGRESRKGEESIRKVEKVVAAYNQNEGVRMKSSSGGVFTVLAESVLKDGGVVFGARFDGNFEVIHDFVELPSSHSLPSFHSLLQPFRGAKYSQSRIGSSYNQCKEFLRQGRKVLFSGTGCQIAGLKLFLRKEYENLLTVEIACHGVPSPKVWREYVRKVTDGKSVTDINFRDKRNGWNGYGLSFKGKDSEIMYERAFTNDYMQCFLLDLCVRPSCSNCPAKAGASGADLLVGDFWGVESLHPEMHDDKGCSIVLAYSRKGKESIESIEGKEGLKTLEIPYEEAYRYNPALIQSTHESRYAPIFWYNFKKYGIEAAPKTLQLIRSPKIKRMIMLGLFKLKGNL